MEKLDKGKLTKGMCRSEVGGGVDRKGDGLKEVKKILVKEGALIFRENEKCTCKRNERKVNVCLSKRGMEG